MNKIVIRSVLFTLVFALLLLVIFKSRTPFGKHNSSFAAEPQREITRIEFSEGARRLTLEKKEDNWLLDGKTETRKGGILFILRILKEIKIKSPVSDELFKTEVIGKEIIPVKVKVYEKRKLLKSFLVYKTRSNSYGNIMKIKGTAKPFIVYLPGYEGDIGSGFTLNELFWQPYTVFNLLPSQISSIDFENLADTASSFSIFHKNQRIVLSDRSREIYDWDSTRITRYLSYFTWIPFESWALDIGMEEKKTVESQEPVYRITVSTTGGTKTVLTLWEKVNLENNLKTKDTDRLLGKTQNSDQFFIIRYFDIDPILKKRAYFFP